MENSKCIIHFVLDHEHSICVLRFGIWVTMLRYISMEYMHGHSVMQHSCLVIATALLFSRRLDMMGLSGKFAQIPSPLDEEALQVELASETISPEDYARVLAERKAQALGIHLSKQKQSTPLHTTFIIGSDTIVDLEGHILNKPVDKSDAVDMLTRLSGNWHRVHTGVALYTLSAAGGENREHVCLFSSFTDTANVKFANLSEEDIEACKSSQVML